jgi:ABC-2 type transport system permease protein
MNAFIAFVKKEFNHIFRDTRTLVVLFGMPLAQLILFGFAITTEIKQAGMVIYDQSSGTATQALSAAFTSSDFFVLKKRVHSYDELGASFRDGTAKIGVIIPADIEKPASNQGADLQIITDASDPNLASILTQSARAIITKWQVQQSRSEISPLGIQTEIKWHYNSELKSVYTFVPGVVTVILMLVSAMLTSISITREKELGTIDVLFVSPLRPAVIIVGKVVPFVLLSLLNAAFILVMAWIVFGVPITGSIALLSLESFLFILTSLSLGIFISTVTQTQQTALMLSLVGLMLPTILLSGFIFPISNMPIPLQVISNIIPAKWFLIIIKAVMLKGIGLSFIWKETLILILMSLVVIGLSIRKFKTRKA